MCATYSVAKDHNYGINQTLSRETLVHCPGSASRENSVQVLATTNSGSERNKFLSSGSKIKAAVTGRVEVVEGEFSSSERQTTENRNTTVNDTNGCFQNRLGAVCQGTTTGGTWSYQERTKHINILELIAVKHAIMTFTKGKSVTTIHFQIDNMTALSYLAKMGGTRSPELLQVAKEIWDYLLANGIAVTAEYLPSSLNIQADWQSRNHRDSSDWKLNPKIFSQIVKIRGIPQIDLFASRLNHRLPKYMSWHPDPGSCAVDSLQHS